VLQDVGPGVSAMDRALKKSRGRSPPLAPPQPRSWEPVESTYRRDCADN